MILFQIVCIFALPRTITAVFGYKYNLTGTVNQRIFQINFCPISEIKEVSV